MGCLVRTTAGSQDDTEDDEADNGEDLDGRKPELAFAVDTGASEVNRKNDNEADGDPDAVVDSLVPVIDQYCSRRELSRKDNGPVVPLLQRKTREKKSGLEKLASWLSDLRSSIPK